MNTYIESLPTLAIIVLFVLALILLSQVADKLIEKAVSLSFILGLSKMVVGATILSVGTTLPEVASSVAATLNGNAQLGLGNAIGSVITNTSLVMGIGAGGGLLPIREETKKTFMILSVTALFFIGTSIGFGDFPNEGLLPRSFGTLFLTAVPFYIWYTVKKKPEAILGAIEEVEEETGERTAGQSSDLAKRIGLLLLSSLGVTLGATLLSYPMFSKKLNVVNTRHGIVLLVIYTAYLFTNFL